MNTVEKKTFTRDGVNYICTIYRLIVQIECRPEAPSKWRHVKPNLVSSNASWFRISISTTSDHDSVSITSFHVNVVPYETVILDYESIAHTAQCLALQLLLFNGSIGESQQLVAPPPTDLKPIEVNLLSSWGFDGNNKSTVRQQLNQCVATPTSIITTDSSSSSSSLVRGPVTAYRLIHRATNTQMVLFGDFHQALPDSKNCGQVSWFQWLERELEPSIPMSVCVDVFLELAILRSENKTPSFVNPMPDQGWLFGTTAIQARARLERSASANIKNSNMRLHSADIRLYDKFNAALFRWQSTSSSYYSTIEDLREILAKHMSPTHLHPDNHLPYTTEGFTELLAIMRQQARVNKQWEHVDILKQHTSIRKAVDQRANDLIAVVVNTVSLSKETLVQIFTVVLLELLTLVTDEYVIGRALRNWPKDEQHQRLLETQHGRYVVMYLGNAHIIRIANTLINAGYEMLTPFIGLELSAASKDVKQWYETTARQCNDYVPLQPLFRFDDNNINTTLRFKRQLELDVAATTTTNPWKFPRMF